MYSPELQNQINVWRRKSIDGTITKEEMRAATAAIRAGRVNAAQAAKASKSRKTTAPPRDAEEMLKGLI